MAITDYATLATALSDWDERDHAGDADELIGLAEAEFRIYFGPSYVKETTATITFASGLATLPTGYVRAILLTHSTAGPLEQTSWEALDTLNPYSVTGDPSLYAISGTSIKTAPLYTGDLTFTYEGTLTGLSGSNTTNWLITYAPQAYLSMCLSMAKAKFEDYQGAAVLKGQALQTLADLGLQATVARYGHAGMTIRGATP